MENHRLRLAVLALVMLISLAPAGVSSASGPDAERKAFLSRSLQVALDYPSDWTVAESPRGAMFTSPQRATILLGVVDTGVLSPEEFRLETQLPHVRCTSRTNRYGTAVRICFDSVSFAYSADFVITPGAGRLLSLVMRRRGELEVFNEMIESLRPAW